MAPAGDSQALATLATTLLNDPELASDTGWRNRTEAEKLYGIETYRAKLHTMVTQWLMRFPGWFPYIQPPNGPVYAWGEGRLRTVLILEPASVRARLFPLTVIQALPISPLPPLAIGQPVHEGTEHRSGHRTGRSRSPHSTHRSRVRNRMKQRGTGIGGRKLKASKKKKQRVRVGQPIVRKRTPGKTKRSRARRRLSNRR